LKKNVLLVVNPISGDLDKTEIVAAVALYAAKEDLNFVLYTTLGQDDIPKIRSLYDHFRPERVLVAGGDGTIKMVAESLENCEVILGIVPAGSSNGLATDLNLPEDLEAILEIAFESEGVAIDILSINGIWSMLLIAIGLNALLIKNYEAGELRGKWGYALQVFPTLLETEAPFTASITANNRTFECESRMIVIANSRRYGTGVLINPNGAMNDGLFELIILKNLDLVLFGKIISGNMPSDSEEVEILSTREATIKTLTPVPFQIDGEYCGEVQELNIRMLRHPLKIAVPLVAAIL